MAVPTVPDLPDETDEEFAIFELEHDRTANAPNFSLRRLPRRHRHRHRR